MNNSKSSSAFGPIVNWYTQDLNSLSGVYVLQGHATDYALCSEVLRRASALGALFTHI